MITLLYGSYGSGKTSAILESIAKDLENGIHTFLLVPEQETVQFEHTTLQRLPASVQLSLEVLNFSRLYNRVCREYGGISYRYVTKPIRHLLMWQNLRELAPILEEYGTLAGKDAAFGNVMLSAINECKASAITPEILEQTAKKLNADDPLGRQLRDLALIFSSFDRLVSQNYSDSSDDLSRLYDILTQNKFFEGAHVYIDSFTSFTSVEHRIIERIFAQAAQVTVSVPISNPESCEISSVGIRDSLKKLICSAAKHGGHTTEILGENRRAQTPALAYLADNIWQMSAELPSPPSLDDGSVCFEVCETPYSEAEATAAHILELLRQGERCRDIAVLMRNPEHYRGIIDSAFDKAEISYFFSQKSEFCSLPPMKLLLSALRIKQYHWRRDDVISHVKTGMYDFSLRSCDLFEEYVTTWNIQGNRFTDGEWTMNPDGFVQSVSDRGKLILKESNEIRRRLVDTLENFFVLLDAAENISDMCRAVYRYFSEISLEDRLFAIAERENSRGNYKESRELQSLYGIILNTLADIAAAVGEESANSEEFALILKTVFEQTEIGMIPTSVDEVMIGSAAMSRVFNPKFVFVLGLCEGEFPAAVKDEGLFSLGDRNLLANLGMEFDSNVEIRSSDELMYVHRAFAAPSHRLYLFTSRADAAGKSRPSSLPFNRAMKLLGIDQAHSYDGSDLRYLAGDPRNAASHLRKMKDTVKGETLKSVLCEHFPNVADLSGQSTVQADCRISEDSVSSVLGDKLYLSPSRFEEYVKCPFNYYCTHILDLREQKTAQFRASNMGSFIHYILEHLLKFAISEREDGTIPEDEELIAMTEKKVEAYIEEICPVELRSSRRLQHLYARLKHLALLMVRNIVEEFSHSEFRPAFFELPTNGRDANPAPMEFVTESGCRVCFRGIIDRVDVLKKNGRVWIRIVDYKTGTKSFSLDDIAHGINFQMLLYLFTLCRNTNSAFYESLGLDPKTDENPTPAGILYLSANIPVLQLEHYENESEILEKTADSLKRSGLLLNDAEVLMAMNSDLSSRFLAGVKVDKNGELVGKALTDEQTFGKIYTQIQTVIEKITDELRGGIADAKPLQYGNQNPCEYCNMRPICRRDDQ